MARRARPAHGARSGLGQVANRPHQGGGGRGRSHQGGRRAVSQGPAADDQGDAADRAACAGRAPFYVNTANGPGCRPPTIRAGPPSARSASAAAIFIVSWKKPTREARHRLGRLDVQIVAFSGDDQQAVQRTGSVPDQSRLARLRIEAARSTRRRRGTVPACSLWSKATAPIWPTAGQAARCSTKPRPANLAQPRRHLLWSRRTAGKLAVLFPGQGAQYAGMCRDLACHFPQASRDARRLPTARTGTTTD